MIYFTVVFLCFAGLFLALLEDRYRLWTTLIGVGVTYVLSLVAAFILRRALTGEVLTQQLPCAVGALLFFICSLFLFNNNPLQKLFLALLSLCNFSFLGFFIPLLLGAMPFSTAGAFAGVFSVAACLLFTLLIGLCLYRPYHHYSDRGISGFLVGMVVLLGIIYPLTLGYLDLLFRGNIFFGRLVLIVMLYAVLIFGFRCQYHAGLFRQKTAEEAARSRMMEMESGDFADMLAAVREVKAAQKRGEYALDTVTVLLQDGHSDKVVQYIGMAKENAAQSPILAQYHENPYLNAVIATKAAFAAQNDIAFSCNARGTDSPLKTAEQCIIVNEMLTRACMDAAAFPGQRKLRFTVIPGEDVLRFEAVYSADPPKAEKFTLKGKSVRDVLDWLLEDEGDGDAALAGLENTTEIVSRYSGKLELSGVPGEAILQATLLF